MRLIVAISSLLFASSAVAQYSAMAPAASSSVSAPAAPSASSTSTVNVQVVKVSNKNGDLKFEPNNIVAAAGTMVQFQFYPKAHSVVQSTFAQPCVPINNVMSNVTGFFSGFMPTTPDAQMKPVYTIMVNDTKPIWYYCSQGKHCQAGMVGVINAPAASPDKNIGAFAALAANAPQNISPGQSSNSTGMGSGSNYTMTAMPPAATTTDASAPTDTAAAFSTVATTASTTTTGGVATFTGGAAGSFIAGTKEVYRGCAAAAVLVAFTAFVM